MDDLQLTKVPVVKTGMLIRKTVADVFEAFVNPDITTKFWFTKSSGRLEAGKQVQWEWEMYGISFPVSVKALERNKRILIEWPGQGGACPGCECLRIPGHAPLCPGHAGADNSGSYYSPIPSLMIK